MVQAPARDFSKPEKVDYPGEVVTLQSLGQSHPVIKYLQDERRFNIKELDELWGVRWIEESDHKNIFDSNRLVFPIMDRVGDGIEMVGWQTRYFDYHTGSASIPSKRTPKYVTEGRPSTLLYNFWRAGESDLLVICEGVFDAIRVGTEHGVCTFGKTLSARQADLIENRFLQKGGKVVFAFDPDVKEKNWKKIMGRVAEWPGVRYLNFPEGFDMADYSQDDVDKLIKSLKNKETT